MERYIQQLLDDLKKAEENPTPETDFGNTYEEFSEAMMKIETEVPSHSKDILNVSFEELPTSDHLSQKQMKTIVQAIVNALNVKGTGISFPGENPPIEVCYTALKNHFKDGFFASPGWNIDFCSGWCPDCEFVDYCNIKDDTWTAEELAKERNK